MLVEEIVKELAQILTQEREKYAKLVADRFRNEVPLQNQIFEALRRAIPALKREKCYGRSGAKCDFWSVDEAGIESWVELKLCPTNYCQSFGDVRKNISITQQIGQVILDCEKLRRIERRHERKILLLAYPMPVGDPHPSWKVHEAWILEHATKISPHQQFVLRRNGTEAAINVYVIDV